jgi:hypothetical protein
MTDFTAFSSTFNADAGIYRAENLGTLLMKEATLEDLTFALSRYFVDSLVTTDKSIPPQVEYAKLVNTGLSQLNFFKFVASTLHRLFDYTDAEFSNFTVLSRVDAFTRVSKEEFEESKGYYPYRSVLEQQLTDVQPIELVRAVRLVLQKLVYRFFHTYDVHEMREVGKKNVKVCDPSNATFRRGDRNITTEEFRDFIEVLLEACDVVNGYTQELTEFRDVFTQAARVAKQMRDEYRQANPVQQRQQKSQQQNSQQRPQNRNSQPRFKPQNRRFTQKPKQVNTQQPTAQA